jgi:hypothetical protein
MSFLSKTDGKCKMGMEDTTWRYSTLFTLCDMCQFRKSKVCCLLWSNNQFKSREKDIKTYYGENMFWGINRTQQTQNFELEILTAELLNNSTLLYRIFFPSKAMSLWDLLFDLGYWFPWEMFALVFGLFICFKLLPSIRKYINFWAL